MAIADDFSVAVNGDIRHVSGATHYTVLELHRFLQGVADDESPATANDYLDITSSTPSERSTDNIITLLSTYNIDDEASEYFYAGSVKQGSGDTEVIYSGLQVLGAVNDTNTQLQVIQDNGYYDTTTPFWGDQSTGGYNGNATAGILMRILVKTREFGADIDKKKVRVQARAWGDSYDFFNVTLGEGESVAAVGTTPDAQNDTAIATIQGWTGGDIPTNTEGWQQIDILNGNGNKEYYSKWTYNTNAALMKAIYEHIKEITGNDSPEAAEPYDMNGELFLGITHSFGYDAPTGNFTQNETMCWGTDVTYDALAGGTFTVGDYVNFKNGSTLVNSGKVVYDNGTTQMRVALEDASGATLADDYIIEEASTGTVTAVINVTITNQDKGGGQGIMLAENTTDDKMYFQLIYGVAPVDNLPIRGMTSTYSVDVNGSVTAQTVPKIFIGSYTGSLIGAFGIGIDPDDLLSTDTVQPLVGAAQTPPNNVTFTLSGVVSGEDRILIGQKDTGNNFKWSEMTLATALTGATETQVDVGVGNVPADAPAAGVLRVELDDGRERRVAYTAHGTQYFTIASSDWTDPNDAAITNGVMLAFMDKLAASTSEEFTVQYNADRTLWIRVRDGGSSPIKTFETSASLLTTGGSAVAQRVSDA
jgi:hypothetical protein